MEPRCYRQTDSRAGDDLRVGRRPFNSRDLYEERRAAFLPSQRVVVCQTI